MLPAGLRTDEWMILDDQWPALGVQPQQGICLKQD